MFYSIRHLTRFRYKSPVSESLMELRMHPRTEGPQRCLSLLISVDPRTRVYQYRDYLGNTVEHFDVPGHHRELKIVAEALVEIEPVPEPPSSLEPSAWATFPAMKALHPLFPETRSRKRCRSSSMHSPRVLLAALAPGSI